MASKLTERRKEAGLTQADLAQSLHITLGLSVTQAQISKYEANGEIPARLLRAWAEAIGCTVDDLLPPLQPVEEPIFNFDNSLYGSLKEELNVLLNNYIDRCAYPDELHVKQFRGRVIALIKEIKEKPWVVLTGHFDAGKSHLCNFYLGEDRFPTGYRPVTRYPTFVRHISDRPKWFNEDLWIMGSEFNPEKWGAQDHCTKNRILAGSWDTLQQHATLKGSKDNSEEGAVLAFVDAPLLHSCVLVDLPGYDDTMINASVIDRLGRRAAILLYLSCAQGFLDGGDFARLGHLLRSLPRFKEIDDNFPVLGNLFIIATHTHPGITKDQLENQILGIGSKQFYEHFQENLLHKLSSCGQSISHKDIHNRCFFSFYQEMPRRREKLEQALKLLLRKRMPSVREKSVKQEILKFKEDGKAIYAKKIDEYKKILTDKEEAKRHYERLKKEEPERKKRHDREINRIEQKIAKFKDQDLKNLRAIFAKKMEVEELTIMIEQQYTDEKIARKHASAYVLEEIQSQAERFRDDLVDETNKLITAFVRDYNVSIRNLDDEDIGVFDTLFDVKEVRGQLASIGLLYALRVYFGGGKIGVPMPGPVLGLPLALALVVAVAVGVFSKRLYGDSWQLHIAKKIKNLFEKKKVLSNLEDNIGSFWDETLTAFKEGAYSLDKQYKNHVKELKDTFGGGQEDIQALEKRLERYEEVKSFFAAIPWR